MSEQMKQNVRPERVSVESLLPCSADRAWDVLQTSEIRAERDAGKETDEQRGGDHNQRGLEAQSEADGDDEETGKASPFGKRGGKKHAASLAELRRI